MKQCIEKCSKGFYTCCANCELANLCEDACHITEDCPALVEPSERRKLKRAKRTTDKFRTIYILLLVGIMLVIGFGMLILGVLNEISLNQIENTKTEQSIDQAQKDDVSEDLTPYKSLGEFEITHYCGCVECCGKTDGITASGTQATEGRTIAVDTDVIPIGTTVIIDGHEYTAEDTGGAIDGNKIDIFMNSHSAAQSRGKFTREVFIN